MNRWTLFLMSVGFLFIMLSYSVDRPYTYIIGGLAMVVTAVILIIRDKRK